jgi:hypothetical protein
VAQEARCAGRGVDAATRFARFEQRRAAGAFRIRGREKRDLLSESNARAPAQALAKCLEGDYFDENKVSSSQCALSARKPLIENKPVNQGRCEPGKRC